MLGPMLFIIYINNIDEGLTNISLKFADDTKLFGVVTNADGVEKMRTDLYRLCEWSKEWLMLFNFDKYKVIYLGVSNENVGYFMNNRQLETVVGERDLGIVMQNNWNICKKCAKVIGTANQVLGTIYRTFTCKSRNIIRTRVLFVLNWSTVHRHGVLI